MTQGNTVPEFLRLSVEVPHLVVVTVLVVAAEVVLEAAAVVVLEVAAVVVLEVAVDIHRHIINLPYTNLHRANQHLITHVMMVELHDQQKHRTRNK